MKNITKKDEEIRNLLDSLESKLESHGYTYITNMSHSKNNSLNENSSQNNFDIYLNKAAKEIVKLNNDKEFVNNKLSSSIKFKNNYIEQQTKDKENINSSSNYNNFNYKDSYHYLSQKQEVGELNEIKRQIKDVQEKLTGHMRVYLVFKNDIDEKMIISSNNVDSLSQEIILLKANYDEIKDNLDKTNEVIERNKAEKDNILVKTNSNADIIKQEENLYKDTQIEIQSLKEQIEFMKEEYSKLSINLTNNINNSNRNSQDTEIERLKAENNSTNNKLLELEKLIQEIDKNHLKTINDVSNLQGETKKITDIERLEKDQKKINDKITELEKSNMNNKYTILDNKLNNIYTSLQNQVLSSQDNALNYVTKLESNINEIKELKEALEFRNKNQENNFIVWKKDMEEKINKLADNDNSKRLEKEINQDISTNKEIINIKEKLRHFEESVYNIENLNEEVEGKMKGYDELLEEINRNNYDSKLNEVNNNIEKLNDINNYLITDIEKLKNKNIEIESRIEHNDCSDDISAINKEIDSFLKQINQIKSEISDLNSSSETTATVIKDIGKNQESLEDKLRALNNSNTKLCDMNNNHNNNDNKHNETYENEVLESLTIKVESLADILKSNSDKMVFFESSLKSHDVNYDEILKNYDALNAKTNLISTKIESISLSNNEIKKANSEDKDKKDSNIPDACDSLVSKELESKINKNITDILALFNEINEINNFVNKVNCKIDLNTQLSTEANNNTKILEEKLNEIKSLNENKVKQEQDNYIQQEEEQNKKIDRILDKINETENTTQLLISNISELNEQSEKLKLCIKDNKNDIDLLKQQCISDDGNKPENSNDIDSIKYNISALEEQNGYLEKEISELTEKVNNFNSVVEDISEKMVKMPMTISETIDKVIDMKELVSESEVANIVIQNNKKSLSSISDDLNKITNSQKLLESKISGIDNQIEQLNVKIAKNSNISINYTSLKEDKEDNRNNQKLVNEDHSTNLHDGVKNNNYVTEEKSNIKNQQELDRSINISKNNAVNNATEESFKQEDHNIKELNETNKDIINTTKQNDFSYINNTHSSVNLETNNKAEISNSVRSSSMMKPKLKPLNREKVSLMNNDLLVTSNSNLKDTKAIDEKAKIQIAFMDKKNHLFTQDNNDKTQMSNTYDSYKEQSFLNTTNNKETIGNNDNNVIVEDEIINKGFHKSTSITSRGYKMSNPYEKYLDYNNKTETKQIEDNSKDQSFNNDFDNQKQLKPIGKLDDILKTDSDNNDDFEDHHIHDNINNDNNNHLNSNNYKSNLRNTNFNASNVDTNSYLSDTYNNNKETKNRETPNSNNNITSPSDYKDKEYNNFKACENKIVTNYSNFPSYPNYQVSSTTSSGNNAINANTGNKINYITTPGNKNSNNSINKPNFFNSINVNANKSNNISNNSKHNDSSSNKDKSVNNNNNSNSNLQNNAINTDYNEEHNNNDSIVKSIPTLRTEEQDNKENDNKEVITNDNNSNSSIKNNEKEIKEITNNSSSNKERDSVLNNKYNNYDYSETYNNNNNDEKNDRSITNHFEEESINCEIIEDADDFKNNNKLNITTDQNISSINNNNNVNNNLLKSSYNNNYEFDHIDSLKELNTNSNNDAFSSINHEVIKDNNDKKDTSKTNNSISEEKGDYSSYRQAKYIDNSNKEECSNEPHESLDNNNEYSNKKEESLNDKKSSTYNEDHYYSNNFDMNNSDKKEISINNEKSKNEELGNTQINNLLNYTSVSNANNNISKSVFKTNNTKEEVEEEDDDFYAGLEGLGDSNIHTEEEKNENKDNANNTRNEDNNDNKNKNNDTQPINDSLIDEIIDIEEL